MFKLTFPVFFFNKKNPHSHSPDFQKFRLAGQADQYIRLYPTSFPRDGMYLYDFDLYKTHKKKLGYTV